MKKWFVNTEFVLLFLVIVAMILKQLHLNGSDLLLLVSLLSLANLYLFFGIASNLPITEKASPYLTDKTLSKPESTTLLVSGISISIVLVGVLFEVLKWEGGANMLMIGLTTGVLTLIIQYFIVRILHAEIFKFIFYRQLSIMAMSAALWYLVSKTIM